jgi:hypothetical protein
MVYFMARVQDLKNPETIALAHCTIQDVMYRRPFYQMQQDDLGNATPNELKFWRHLKYVPITLAKAEEVINQYHGIYRNTVLVVGKEDGGQWHTDHSHKVKDLRSWLEVDFDVFATIKYGWISRER